MTLVSTAFPSVVLFDLDGTLLDSAPDLAFAANQLRLARDLPALKQELYRPFVGTGARGMIQIALGIEPNAPNFEQLKEEFFVAYEQVMGRYAGLFEGVPELLRQMQVCNIPWGIVTNKSERFALPIVQATPLFQSAAAVICGDTTAHSKPHPAPLLEACRRAEVTPQRCIYVGDDERDMLAARAAGMRGVAAAYGYLGAEGSVEPWNPDAIVKSPLELLAQLGLR